MSRELLNRARREIERLASAGLDWVTFSVEATEALKRAIPFDRSCWHMVDPGTVLFTGSLNWTWAAPEPGSPSTNTWLTM